jgi:hypothetical protein
MALSRADSPSGPAHTPRPVRTSPGACVRFAGVVDSPDIPLNISRESMQDTALMRRIRSVLTRKVLKYVQARLCVGWLMVGLVLGMCFFFGGGVAKCLWSCEAVELLCFGVLCVVRNGDD